MTYKVDQLEGIVKLLTVDNSDSLWLCGVDQRGIASRDVNLDRDLFTLDYGCVFTSDVALDLMAGKESPHPLWRLNTGTVNVNEASIKLAMARVTNMAPEPILSSNMSLCDGCCLWAFVSEVEGVEKSKDKRC